MYKTLYKVSEGTRSLTVYECPSGHNFHRYHFSETPISCYFCEVLERLKATEEKHSIVIGEDRKIACAACGVKIYNPFNLHHDDFRFECCCHEHLEHHSESGPALIDGKRKRHNLKRREKAKARKAERRAALLAADEGLIGAIVDVLKTEKPKLVPDLYMIKGVLDKIEFHNLCQQLALLCEADQIKTLQRVAEAHKWNRAELCYLETILALACVLAEEIRVSP